MHHKRNYTLALILALALLLSGCTSAADQNATDKPDGTTSPTGDTQKPAMPSKLELDDEGIPTLSVYDVDEEGISEMDIETYLLGVLAGEMKNDWPMEALKAQAILARTFVLKFCTEKESQYQGADISTDIEEAQAYDATGVNERIVQAVEETRGLVLSQKGELPYAWFHAHSGGMTALAKEGLAYEKAEPGYTQVVKGNESSKAPKEAQEWTASFSSAELLAAAKKAGLKDVTAIETVTIGDKGDSGRALTILINGKSVSAPELRIALGSTQMRSTLLTSLEFKDGTLSVAGKGYGHGVGMPQWGAYGMAESGKTAEDIVMYYFKDVQVVKMW